MPRISTGYFLASPKDVLDAHKACDLVLNGFAEDLFGRYYLHDYAAYYHANAICKHHCLGLVVGDMDCGQPGLVVNSLEFVPEPGFCVRLSSALSGFATTARASATHCGSPRESAIKCGYWYIKPRDFGGCHITWCWGHILAGGAVSLVNNL
ncbi:MAG: hypothetical protein EF813_03690 [Methanosarcinales archaeon]|nr:MAG: hypothetical protein EF813_03690 [Methanosarcinales archaeon]